MEEVKRARHCGAPDNKKQATRLWKGQVLMPPRTGRIERRIRLAVPVQISSVEDPSAIERAITENVCSIGVRVVSQAAKELNERLSVKFLAGDLRSLARVVYCQRLPDGRFGVGLQFQDETIRRPTGSLSGAND